jgi:hypothetical protein
VSEKCEDDYKQEMQDDLGMGDLYNVPVWLASIIDRLIEAGWRKP